MPAIAPGLPAAVLAGRTDVAAAWQHVVAAGLGAERIGRERVPALTLTGHAGFVSQAMRRWLAGESLAWLAQATLVAPMLDGGRQQACAVEVRAARRQRDAVAVWLTAHAALGR